MLLENEFKDDSKKLPTLPLRSRLPITASFHCCSPSPFCSSCFTAPSAAGAATTAAAAAAAPSTAPAAAAATAEFASALLVLGGGRAVMVGDKDSRISFMLLLLLLVVAPTARGEEEDGADGAGGSISEEWMLDKPLLLSSDRDELLVLVLLPPPLLRRRKRDAMVLGPLASPRAGLWGMLGGMKDGECSCSLRPADECAARIDGCGRLLPALSWQPNAASWRPCRGVCVWMRCWWERWNRQKIRSRGSVDTPSTFLAHLGENERHRTKKEPQPPVPRRQGHIEEARLHSLAQGLVVLSCGVERALLRLLASQRTKNNALLPQGRPYFGKYCHTDTRKKVRVLALAS